MARKVGSDSPTADARMIGKDDFLKLIGRRKNIKRTISEKTGELGGLIADAVENKNLHKKMFGWIAQLDGMPAEKREEALACFELYTEYAATKWEDAPNMLDESGADKKGAGAKRKAKGKGKNGSADKGVTAKAEDEKDLRPRHLKQPGATVSSLDDARNKLN